MKNVTSVASYMFFTLASKVISPLMIRNSVYQCSSYFFTEKKEHLKREAPEYWARLKTWKSQFFLTAGLAASATYILKEHGIQEKQPFLMVEI